MRIISGSARGKRLSPLSGGDIRPTPDRVREAVFSILGSRLDSFEGLRVLDLFAGSGALALEALSRGAAHAVLVDSGQQASRIIPANIRACSMEARATFIRSEVSKTLAALPQGNPFDLIFLDPPYGRGLIPTVLATIAEEELLGPGGLVCAEAGKKEDLPGTVASLTRIEQRHYGSTAVHLFTLAESEVSA